MRPAREDPVAPSWQRGPGSSGRQPAHQASGPVDARSWEPDLATVPELSRDLECRGSGPVRRDGRREEDEDQEDRDEEHRGDLRRVGGQAAQVQIHGPLTPDPPVVLRPSDRTFVL